jgi:hypothetical protein
MLGDYLLAWPTNASIGRSAPAIRIRRSSVPTSRTSATPIGVTLRKTKFVVLAMTARVSADAELPPPMFEHLAMDQARCRNPLYSGSIHGESSPSRQAAQSCVYWQGKTPRCGDSSGARVYRPVIPRHDGVAVPSEAAQILRQR